MGTNFARENLCGEHYGFSIGLDLDGFTELWSSSRDPQTQTCSQCLTRLYKNFYCLFQLESIHELQTALILFNICYR